ncbi:DCA17 factor, partial [Atractosteus spatula]|nr:DCA17 factor [Atractosteus spatula]
MASCSTQNEVPTQNSYKHNSPRTATTSKWRNAHFYLSSRSIGLFSRDAGTLYRKNMRMLRHILLQDTTNFTNVWRKHSKGPIDYEHGKIYFENYRSCYSSIPPKPQCLYELPNCSKSQKIEDALICQCPLDRTLPSPSDRNPCLLALNASNWLYCYSAMTGEQLEKVYLSPRYKFRYLCWDVPQETLCIKSVQNKQTSIARQTGPEQDTLMCLAVFRVLPLELLGMLEISRRVFGNNVVDVMLSQGILAISHSTGMVKLYSFENIVEKFMIKKLTLGEKCEWNGIQGSVGESPLGIPFNIQITDSPTLMFEVSCLESGFQIGGHPWHYIYTPRSKKHKGTYHICSLKDGQLAKNGIQDMNCCSLESDWIYFHPGDSGRIIHVGPSKVNVLKIVETQESLLQFEVIQEYSIEAHRENKADSLVTVTASGRTVRRRLHQLDDDPEQETFQCVEYEDELDLLAVVSVTQTESEGKAHVGIYDNWSGVLMKSVPLVESWDVTYGHQFFFDCDTIVHIEQEKNHKFCCHVYKMTRCQEDNE